MSENTIEMSETKNFAKVFATPERDYLVLRSFDNDDIDNEQYHLSLITYAYSSKLELLFKFTNEVACFNAYMSTNADNVAACFKDTLDKFDSLFKRKGVDNGEA